MQVIEKLGVNKQVVESKAVSTLNIDEAVAASPITSVHPPPGNTGDSFLNTSTANYEGLVENVNNATSQFFN